MTIKKMILKIYYFNIFDLFILKKYTFNVLVGKPLASMIQYLQCIELKNKIY